MSKLLGSLHQGYRSIAHWITACYSEIPTPTPKKEKLITHQQKRYNANYRLRGLTRIYFKTTDYANCTDSYIAIARMCHPDDNTRQSRQHEQSKCENPRNPSNLWLKNPRQSPRWERYERRFWTRADTNGDINYRKYFFRETPRDPSVLRFVGMTHPITS